MFTGFRDNGYIDKNLTGLAARRFYALAAGCLLLTAILYLGWSGLDSGGGVHRDGKVHRLGFPLDDAWIHQTYARNLVRYRQFAYLPGHVSAGSTAPLWTLLLAPVHMLGIDPLVWSYALGGFCLFLLGLGVFRLGAALFPDRAGWAAWAGLAAMIEWHLAWAAFSGMETLLFAGGVVWLLERYMAWESNERHASPASHAPLASSFMLGILSGALILARPEGLLLVGLLAVAAAMCTLTLVHRRRSFRRTILMAIDGLAGMSLLLIPYLVFNYLTSGSLFPNTFYAKQAEYAVLRAQPLWQRFWQVFQPTIVGGQVILAPGAIYALIGLLRSGKALPSDGARCTTSPELNHGDDFDRRAGLDRHGGLDRPRLGRYTRMVPLLWWLLTLSSYALRLPVSYQHGRYLIPTIPMLLLFGIMGTLSWLQPRSPRLSIRVVSRAVPWIVLLSLLAFLPLGARAFATDVAIINGEMVAAAQWLNAHTPPDAVIAVHDIGAIGYFTGRPLLDLAGLVTPEIIPVIRDEAQLLEWIVAHRANYLVTFPSWYSHMVTDQRLHLVYQTDCLATRAQGGDNMAVYQVDGD